MRNQIGLLLLALALLVSCSSDRNFKASLESALRDNPELITDLVKENPEKFINAFREAAIIARNNSTQNRAQSEERELENYIENPLEMNIRPDELIRGAKKGKIRIIEYSDFQCPFCARGFETVKEVMAKYKGEIAFIFKHLPIDSIHPKARLAAKYYEAIRIVSGEKAFLFHDRLLSEQSRIRLGKSYLDKVVLELGLDLVKIQKISKSEVVNKRIRADEAEAKKFGFSGTPGFLVEGVPVKGAYPFEHFVKIIDRIKIKNSL